MRLRIPPSAVLLASSLGLIGCGGNSTAIDEAPKRALTDAEKAQFQSQLDDANNAERAERKREASEKLATRPGR
ncbi:hypothetical protein TA3x_004774 [Tundrisphaera sp. TA3]|uniref:hypothetical protein n=1 Tax=Tundrisphaera sp. TA3 TaxID=3435775 RepID=UPI003EB8C9B9